MKKIVFIIPFLFGFLLLKAQSNNSYLKNVIMPSPTAASLGKYGDIPVGYYTGVPNISIPIHTVNQGPLSLPITLSYHASGVKVDEVASWVGLNWSLQAGGMVSRTVQGIKDEDAVGGWYYVGDNIPSPTNACAFENFVPSVNSGVNDSEPDIFSFDFLGYNGKFYLTNNNNSVNKVILVPKQDIKITPIFSSNTSETNHLKGFTIITPDGIQFTFGDNGDGSPAIETLASASGSYPLIPSSWYLKTIQSYDGKFVINLNYENEDMSLPYIPSHTSCDNSNGGMQYPTTFSLTTLIQGKRLQSITTNTETVSFSTTTSNREDVAPHPSTTNFPKALSAITITSGAFQKKFNFSYDYWVDNSSDAVAAGDLTVNKRLRLLNIQEQSGDNSIINPPYTFDYFIKTGSPNFMPHRLSRSIDHWGFYNGKNNGPYNSNTMNVGYLSATCFNGQTCVNNVFSFPGGSDRETDEASMKYGTLRKVTYPTGGNTEFDMEANDYYSSASIPTTVTVLNIPPASTCSSFSVVGSPNPVSFSASDLPTLKYELTLKSIGCACPAQVSMEVKVYRTSDNAFIATSGQYQLDCTLPSGQGVNYTGLLQTLFAGQLLSGVNYRFEIFFSKSSAQFKILKETTIALGNVKVGGLRVKQIKTHDGISITNDIIRNFEYKDSLYNTQSSGVLYQKPVYSNAYTFYGCPASPCGNNCTACYPLPVGGCNVTFFDNSIMALSSFEGYHIGYKFVKEIFPNNGYNTYTYQTENAVTNNSFPQPPALARILAGNLKYSTTRNQSAVVIAYESHIPQNDSYSLSTETMFKVSQQCGNFLTLYQIRTRPYREQNITNALDGVVSTTIYTYDAGNRFLFPVTEKVNNSDGKEYLTEYTYNYDYAANTTIRDELVNRFLIERPWAIKIKVNGVQVDGSELEYAFYNLASGAQQTGSVGAVPRIYKYFIYDKTWNSIGTLVGNGKTLKATVDSYDANGRRTSFTAANWPAETYTWETNNELKTVTFNGYTTEYQYHSGTSMLSKRILANGQETWYDYDPLMRLVKQWELPSTANTKTSAKVTTDYEYRFRSQTTPLNSFGENYVRTAVTYAAAPTGGGTSGLTMQEVFEYSDGIGRDYQTVNRKQSPAQKDVVSFVEYDNFGRRAKVYNPVESANNTGAKLATIPSGTLFTLSEFFSDPISRIWKVTPPSWYATTYSYGTNASNDVLLNYVGSYYTNNTLYKTTITGPDNKVLVTYEDKNGQTILLRRTDTANSGPSNTYTVYDDKGRVVKVIPPGSTNSSTTLNFEYSYDDANNIITKKKPDAALVNLKYNTRNQIALVQDGNLLAQNKWNCIQYDDFGRVLKTGLFSGTIPSPITSSLAPTELYTENIYGTTGIEKGKLKTKKSKAFDAAGTWLQTTYAYDSYGRVNASSGNNYLLPSDLNAESTTFIYDFANNILKDSRVSKKTSTTSYSVSQTHNFDHWGRISLNTHQVNGGVVNNISQLNYNWKNEMIEKNLGKAPTYFNYLQSLDFIYNDMGWLTRMNSASLGGSNTALVSCPTNPTMPNPGAASNIPDNNDLFYLELKYDALEAGLGGTINKNGNISQVLWRVRGRERQSYSLTYDYLDRISTAQYSSLSDAQVPNNVGAWNENLSYDIRGNITALSRTGKYKTAPSATCWTDGEIDNLAYTYLPNMNRLQRIVDSAPTASKANGWNNVAGAGSTAEYQYDANGNMTSDPFKNMSVSYNYMNLPNKFTFADPVNGPKTVDILYDGTGNKLRKTVKVNGVLQYQQDYVDAIEYNTTNSVALSLESIYNLEGRVFNTNVGTTNPDALRYEYSIKDHLGNTRLTFTDKNNNGIVDVNNTGTNEILQENHYYPFGLNMPGPWMDDASASDNKYQYNGKGINNDFGLDWEDYGNRWYDPASSRFHTTDKLSADFPFYSPYQYASNTPMNAVDMDGLEAYYSSDGTFLRWGTISGRNAPVILVTKAGFPLDLEEQEQLYIGGKPLTHFEFEQTAAFAYNETWIDEELDRFRIPNTIVNNYYFYYKNNPNQEDKRFQYALDNLRYKNDSHEDRMSGIAKKELTGTNKYAIFFNMDVLERNKQPRAKSAVEAAINAFRKDGIDYTETIDGRRAYNWKGAKKNSGSHLNRYQWHKTPHSPEIEIQPSEFKAIIYNVKKSPEASKKSKKNKKRANIT